MADILVRSLNAETVRRLKVRAKQHGRSLQSEARLVLEQAAGAGPQEIREMLDGWRRKLAGRKLDPSADLIRRDRRR